MDKGILYKFFAGQASASEIEMIKKWTEESSGNLQELIAERNVFDMLQLSDYYDKPEGRLGKHRSQALRFVRIAFSSAAAVAFVVLGTLALRNMIVEEEPTPTLNTIMVPAGQRANVILADGTNVWLNAGSKLVYPSSFEKDSREVTLEGEAFFDVTRNEDSPFRVKTSILDIKVLGTQFNLLANSSRGEFEAALMQGKIDVCKTDTDQAIVTLHPNQVAVLSDGRVLTRSIEFEDQYRWKEGLYCFKNETIKDIISDLEKYYDVKIVLNNTRLNNTKLTGKFRIAEGLDYALRVLQMNAKFTFEKDKESGTVYIN